MKIVFNGIMKLDNFPDILWINLDRSFERRKYMENLLNEYQLKHSRIKAIDGYLSEEITNKCVCNSKFSPGENGCTVSHLIAMEYFINNTNEDKIIIMEDDISFEFLQYIPYNWSTFMEHLPSDYDIIQLAITHETPIKNYLVRSKPELKYYCSAAYLITREGAKKIISQYFSPEINKFVLSNKINVTADSMITNTVKTFSIPIFTYQNYKSTIHQYHFLNHSRAKFEQTQMWKSFSDIFDQNTYFSQFEKE